MTRVCYQLGPVTIAAECDRSTIRYLDDFYDRTASVGRTPSWFFRCSTTPVSRLPLRVTPAGVGTQIDLDAQATFLSSEDPGALRVALRKLIRELFICSCEARSCTMLHASAFFDGSMVLMLVGDRGAGKTTLALDAVLRHGFQLLSNDHLVIFPKGSEYCLTTAPSLIGVKVGTQLALRTLLPPHPDVHAVDLARFAKMEPNELRHQQQTAYFTSRGLGQPRLPQVTVGAVGRHQLWIVFPRFESVVTSPEPLTNQSPLVRELNEHRREDWLYHDSTAPTCHRAGRRNLARFAADSYRLCSALAANSRALRWAHKGDVAPLLSYVRGRPVDACGRSPGDSSIP
jgi:hypothetical protein